MRHVALLERDTTARRSLPSSSLVATTPYEMAIAAILQDRGLSSGGVRCLSRGGGGVNWERERAMCRFDALLCRQRPCRFKR